MVLCNKCDNCAHIWIVYLLYVCYNKYMFLFACFNDELGSLSQDIYTCNVMSN